MKRPFYTSGVIDLSQAEKKKTKTKKTHLVYSGVATEWTREYSVFRLLFLYSKKIYSVSMAKWKRAKWKSKRTKLDIDRGHKNRTMKHWNFFTFFKLWPINMVNWSIFFFKIYS